MHLIGSVRVLERNSEVANQAIQKDPSFDILAKQPITSLSHRDNL